MYLDGRRGVDGICHARNISAVDECTYAYAFAWKCVSSVCMSWWGGVVGNLILYVKMMKENA